MCNSTNVSGGKSFSFSVSYSLYIKSIQKYRNFLGNTRIKENAAKDHGKDSILMPSMTEKKSSTKIKKIISKLFVEYQSLFNLRLHLGFPYEENISHKC